MRNLSIYIYLYINIALRRFLHNHGNIATEGSPKVRLCPTLISNDFKGSLYSVLYHRQHCTIHAFEQVGALYLHNHDDKYPTRPGFEPGTSRSQAPVNTNEPSGPAEKSKRACHTLAISVNDRVTHKKISQTLANVDHR